MRYSKKDSYKGRITRRRLGNCLVKLALKLGTSVPLALEYPNTHIKYFTIWTSFEEFSVQRYVKVLCGVILGGSDKCLQPNEMGKRKTTNHKPQQLNYAPLPVERYSNARLNRNNDWLRGARCGRVVNFMRNFIPTRKKLRTWKIHNTATVRGTNDFVLVDLLYFPRRENFFDGSK